MIKQQIQIVKLGFSVETVKTIMRQCIGRQKGLSKVEILTMLLPEWSNLSDIEQYYYRDKLAKIFTQMRRQNFYVVSIDGDYFVPTEESDLEDFETKINANIKGMKISVKKAHKFIKHEMWRDLTNES